MSDLRQRILRGASGALFVLLLAAAFIRSIGPEAGEPVLQPEKFTAQCLSMGTVFRVTISAAKEDSEVAREALAKAMDVLADLEGRISSWRPGSETARVNAAAGIEPVEVGSELTQLITRSLDWAKKTGGAFDVTGGPLFELWQQARDREFVPSDKDIEFRHSLTGFRNIQASDRRVYLEKAGMKLGFGGIGKGFAADRVAATLEARGFSNFLIDAGGDLLARGRCGERSWQVAVRHPRHRGFLARLECEDCAIATSGDYERYFVAGGKRYSHILDLRTGWPAERLTAVTVIARSATDADALATGLFVMAPSEGMALVESLPEVEAVLVGDKGNLTLSGGLRLQGDELTINWE